MFSLAHWFPIRVDKMNDVGRCLRNKVQQRNHPIRRKRPWWLKIWRGDGRRNGEMHRVCVCVSPPFFLSLNEATVKWYKKEDGLHVWRFTPLRRRCSDTILPWSASSWWWELLWVSIHLFYGKVLHLPHGLSREWVLPGWGSLFTSTHKKIATITPYVVRLFLLKKRKQAHSFL